MTRPFLTPAEAAQVLALVSVAQARSPESPLAFIVGYATRAAGELVLPEVPPTNGHAIGRVQLRRGC